MGFSSIMNPQYAALRALGIPAGHHDATRFVYFWAPPYLLFKNRMWWNGLIATAVITAIVQMLAYPVPGVGIAVPVFVSPIATALVAVLIARDNAAALAYVSGSLGTLIGADLLNLDAVRGLGAPVASVGGACSLVVGSVLARSSVFCVPPTADQPLDKKSTRSEVQSHFDGADPEHPRRPGRVLRATAPPAHARPTG
jgi:hypothetical protein